MLRLKSDFLKMNFELVWDEKAIKDLENLPKEIAQRIIRKVEEAQANPLRYVERLVGQEVYKLRVGDFRIFVLIDYNPNKLKISAIRHRKDAYKKK